MPEITYSKKQLAPLIEKFGIDVEKNTLFHRVINLFSNQPNYHLWAVKAVFGGAADIQTLENIKSWADANPKLIQQLSNNGNIVSYTTSGDIKKLCTEIDGISRKALVNDVISTFNTDQRKMLKSAIRVDYIDNVAATKDKEFTAWFNLLSAFSCLHKTKKSKVIRSLSAVRDGAALKQLISDALKESYVWDKEDMLNFVKYNCPKVNVVYNMGPIVVLEIPSYEASHKICYGRTTWCITRSSDYFRQYVTDKKGNRQFFFFDFSKKETHELAHVGFTVSPNGGITNAHSTNNSSMLGSGISVDGSNWNIQKVLSSNNIGMGMFMNLKEFTSFKWEMESLVNFVANNKNCDIVYQRDNIAIVKVMDNATLNKMVGFTFIPAGNIPVNNENVAFVLFDLGSPINSNNSIILMTFRKDIYGTLSPNTMYNTYGSNCVDEKPLMKFGIRVEDFLEMKAIEPNILLHKYIDERDEEAAIRLLEEKGNEIDVNYSFNNRIPVFSAIDNKMFNLFSKIIVNDNFNGNLNNGFDENMVQLILWSCYLDPIATEKQGGLSKDKEKEIRDIVISLLDSGKFDVNATDVNDDTVMNIAAMDSNMTWLLDYLVRRPDVNPNIKNDISFSPFTTAINNKNIEGARIIGMRTDLVIDELDKEVAKSNGIDINSLINPTTFEDMGVAKEASKSIGASYHEVLSKIFSKN